MSKINYATIIDETGDSFLTQKRRGDLVPGDIYRTTENGEEFAFLGFDDERDFIWAALNIETGEFFAYKELYLDRILWVHNDKKLRFTVTN